MGHRGCVGVAGLMIVGRGSRGARARRDSGRKGRSGAMVSGDRGAGGGGQLEDQVK